MDTEKATPLPPDKVESSTISLRQYDLNDEDIYLPPIRELISKDLSEPYSIYVYRFFLNNWSQFCWMLHDSSSPNPLIGVIICKLEQHRSGTNRGYIAMLAISSDYRGRGLGSMLAQRAIESLQDAGADEVVLETEEDNVASLKLYRRLSFLRTKHLHRYYLNGKGAYRLVLPLKDPDDVDRTMRRDSQEWDDGLYG